MGRGHSRLGGGFLSVEMGTCRTLACGVGTKRMGGGCSRLGSGFCCHEMGPCRTLACKVGIKQMVGVVADWALVSVLVKWALWHGCRLLVCEVGPKQVGGGRSQLVVVAVVVTWHAVNMVEESSRCGGQRVHCLAHRGQS